MYVKSLRFLVTVSKSLKYTPSMYIKSRKKPQLVSGPPKVIQIYAKYGFVVNFIKGNNEFETLRYDFPKVDFNITAADEHVPEAEQKTRVVKDRTRAVQHTIPFSNNPEKIIISTVNFSVL